MYIVATRKRTEGKETHINNALFVKSKQYMNEGVCCSDGVRLGFFILKIIRGQKYIDLRAEYETK